VARVLSNQVGLRYITPEGHPWLANFATATSLITAIKFLLNLNGVDTIHFATQLAGHRDQLTGAIYEQLRWRLRRL